jgi:hypothetical protein
MNPVVQYFDLASSQREVAVRRGAEGGQKRLHWVPQYVALALGVLIQPYFASYQNTGQWMLEGGWGRVLFAVVAGILILPAVYKRAFDPDKPIVVQLCAIFAAGLGWESLLDTAVKVTGGG